MENGKKVISIEIDEASLRTLEELEAAYNIPKEAIARGLIVERLISGGFMPITRNRATAA